MGISLGVYTCSLKQMEEKTSIWFACNIAYADPD